jgi:hypothetical protein
MEVPFGTDLFFQAVHANRCGKAKDTGRSFSHGNSAIVAGSVPPADLAGVNTAIPIVLEHLT